MKDKEFELRTTVHITVPDEVTIDDITASAEQYDDQNGDYIEYNGYSKNDKDYAYWSIYIQPDEDQYIFMRAMLDGDEVDSTTINPHDIREPSINEIIDEFSAEIMTEIESLRE